MEADNYWARLRAEADNILTRKANEAFRQIVDPEFCLLQSDKIMMQKKQMSAEGIISVRDTVRKGGFWGNLWALDTVISKKPGLVFAANTPANL